jgi:hypothetical protein
MGSLGANLAFVTTLAPPSHWRKPRRFLGFWAVHVAAETGSVVSYWSREGNRVQTFSGPEGCRLGYALAP